MALRVSGKSVDIGESFRGHAEARIDEVLAKYFDGGFDGHVTVEREGPGFRVDCAIHLDTGVTLGAEGHGQDVYQGFDRAADRIEKRLRRYKRRLKEHHPHGRPEPLPASEGIIAAPDEESEVEVSGEPAVIAESTTRIRTMTVGEAVMTMDLADAPVVVFRHAVHGEINVVYRRRDGHVGWIDPSLSKKGRA